MSFFDNKKINKPIVSTIIFVVLTILGWFMVSNGSVNYDNQTSAIKAEQVSFTATNNATSGLAIAAQNVDVYNKPPQKHLDGDTAEKLKEALSPYRDLKIKVSFKMGDEASQIYATEIRDYLSGGGWQTDLLSTMGGQFSTTTDINIVKDDDGKSMRLYVK